MCLNTHAYGMSTINSNAVQGRLFESYLMWKLSHKILDTKDLAIVISVNYSCLSHSEVIYRFEVCMKLLIVKDIILHVCVTHKLVCCDCNTLDPGGSLWKERACAMYSHVTKNVPTTAHIYFEVKSVQKIFANYDSINLLIERQSW